MEDISIVGCFEDLPANVTMGAPLPFLACTPMMVDSEPQHCWLDPNLRAEFPNPSWSRCHYSPMKSSILIGLFIPGSFFPF